MRTKILIPKQLLADIDFTNTISGGVVESTARSWASQDGYKLLFSAPGVDIEKIRIEASNKRFSVFYMLDILEGTAQMPYYLVNVPLAPDVDIERISACVQQDGKILVKAPFNI